MGDPSNKFTIISAKNSDEAIGYACYARVMGIFLLGHAENEVSPSSRMTGGWVH
jgi:hypothetical protein